MKHLQISSLICGGILSISSSALLAQQPSSSSQSSTLNPSSSSAQSSSTLDQSSSSSSLGSSSSLDHSSMNSSQNVRLSNLMSGTVQSQSGKTLGHIRDLVIDPQSGRIQFAILSLSSAGGVSDASTSGRETVPSTRSSSSDILRSAVGASLTGKLVPVPWQLFSHSFTGSPSSTTSSSTYSSTGSTMSQPLVLNIDESKLQSAPSFEASNWNELQSGTFDQRVYSHFGVDRNWGMGTSGSSISGQGTSGSYDHNNHGRSSTSGSTSVPPGASSTSPNNSSSTSPDK
jgi:sporulation protein YlmC with PRC-barrel domain